MTYTIKESLDRQAMIDVEFVEKKLEKALNDIKLRDDLLKKAITSDLWSVRGELKEEIDGLLNPPWYKNIPKKGVLCKVMNYKQGHASIAVINEYCFDAELPFIDIDAIEWRYAIPLTNEEIEAFKR